MTDTTTELAPPPAHTSHLAPTAMLFSLTGFDEIAVSAHFGQKIHTLREDDAIMLGRALAFVHYRREGDTDRDAYARAMGLSIGDTTAFFPPEPPKTEPEDGTPEAEEIATTAMEMAAFCVATGFAPSEWKALTIGERKAVTEEHNRVTEYVNSRARR